MELELKKLKQRNCKRQFDERRRRALVASRLCTPLGLGFIDSGGLGGPGAMDLIGSKGRFFTSALFQIMAMEARGMTRTFLATSSLALDMPHQVPQFTRPTKSGQPKIKQSLPKAWLHLQGEILEEAPDFLECQRHPERTLKIFKYRGQLYFRCHRCGNCLSLLQYAQSVLKLPPEPTLQELIEAEAMEVPPAGWLKTQIAIRGFMNQFEHHRFIHEHQVLQGKVPAAFGEWALFDSETLTKSFSGIVKKRRIRNRRVLVRLERNLFGQPVLAKPYSPRLRALRPRIPLASDLTARVLAAPGAQFMDWTKEALMCLDESTATEAQRMVAQWPESERLPVLCLTHLGDMKAARPFQKLHVLGTPDLRIKILKRLSAPDARLIPAGTSLRKLTPSGFRNLPHQDLRLWSPSI